MKNIGTFFIVLAFLMILLTPLFAQQQGDYRTRDSGDWGTAQIWERYNGASWAAVGTPPAGSETITILEEDSVFVNLLVSITDTLINQGIIEANDNLTIADGGTYKHDRDGGQMPMCTWSEGSTMYMSGVTATAPDDRDQNYYNIVFDTPGLLANLNMNLNTNTIGGDITVLNCGIYGNRWYLTSVLANDTATVTINGDVIVENGGFSVQGTSNANTTFIVHHYGNIIVTGGNFSISRGSQGGGTTTWYIYEGNFFMSNATTQSSTTTVDGAKFIFAKEGTQTITLGEGNTLTALPIEVSSGTILDMGTSTLSGSGNFTVRQGGMIMTTLTGGVNQIVSGVTSIVTLEDGSGYGFNGAEAQVTGTVMPATVGDLTIDNAGGVTLSQATTINGVLRLVSGEFDNTIPFTLGPNGSISYEGGSLKVPVTAIEPAADLNIPDTFFMDQNYPNPFNPGTSIRFGLPAAAYVTARVFNMLGQEVATIFEGRLKAGEHILTFNASHLSSGIYLYRIRANDVVSIKRMVLMK